MTMPAQRPGRSEQSVGTPTVFLDAVRRRLGIEEFDIDLAASPGNNVCPRFYCLEYGFDAFEQQWKCGEGWNWLNPPFSKIRPWVSRALSSYEIADVRTAVLVPAATGSNWWRDCVDGYADVLLLNGRLTFVGHTSPYPKDCALLLYTPDSRGCYEVWDWRKA